jgi:SAM-dependent methyltransferase
VLDAGCGTGALAFALAPHVAEVVGVDTRADYLDAARAMRQERAVLEADVMALPFGYGSSTSPRASVLHHVRRPELAVSDARVTRLGGRLFVADQLGSIDPLRSMEMDRFERLRDAPTSVCSGWRHRGYLDANDLVLLASEVAGAVDLERRLDLAAARRRTA